MLGDKAARIDNIGTRLTQKPSKENTYTAVWSLGDLAGTKAELHAFVFGNERVVHLLAHGRCVAAHGRHAICDGASLVYTREIHPTISLICRTVSEERYPGDQELTSRAFIKTSRDSFSSC